jgi:hypothetical protein
MRYQWLQWQCGMRRDGTLHMICVFEARGVLSKHLEALTEKSVGKI